MMAYQSDNKVNTNPTTVRTNPATSQPSEMAKRVIRDRPPTLAPALFKISAADRVKRLPPYLFGKINALKYAKRRAGIDVIDLGMGNPSDVPDQVVIDKMVE